MSLDDIDRRILVALQNKGRMSNSDLSEKVHLSPSACHRRVQRLEAEGYIRDYVALLNARKLGVPTTVWLLLYSSFWRERAESVSRNTVEGFDTS